MWFVIIYNGVCVCVCVCVCSCVCVCVRACVCMCLGKTKCIYYIYVCEYVCESKYYVYMSLFVWFEVCACLIEYICSWEVYG